ncbi:hypothetical protein MUG91_G72n207 [Manis pentadactyla]|nr:hypothetical protein MUG91_G72n207 [Manis pentadactyla]
MGYPGNSEPPTQRPEKFLQLAQSEKLLSSNLELSAAFLEMPLEVFINSSASAGSWRPDEFSACEEQTHHSDWGQIVGRGFHSPKWPFFY